METKKWAVIDIGSNTIRLVIYIKSNGGSFKEAENIKTVARLRKYLTDEKILNGDGIALLVNILEGFREIVDFHQVPTIFCIATATIRQAKNNQAVLTLVKEKTGFDIQIFSEKEEAYYGYFAVAHSTPIETGITIDMGGGSTEITYFKDRELINYHSFPFGVVSLKDQFMKNSPMTEMVKMKLYAYLEQELNQLIWLKDLKVPIIAIGGSARSIAQMDQNFKKYPIAGIHQYVMSNTDIKNMQIYLSQFSIEQLEKMQELSSDRADIILPALEVFVKLCDYCQSPSFMFSRKGLRDGILLNEMEAKKDILSTEQIINNNIKELLTDYDVNPIHANQRAELAQQLFNQVNYFYHWVKKDYMEKFIVKGAQLYYIGRYIDDDSSSQHTFYLLANQPINGLLHVERVTLALIASFKNKTLYKQYLGPFSEWFTKEELVDIRLAGAIVKIAAALDSSKRSIVKTVKFEQDINEKLQLFIYYDGNSFMEQFATSKHIRHLEKALRKNISLRFIKMVDMQ